MCEVAPDSKYHSFDSSGVSVVVLKAEARALGSQEGRPATGL
jgi:S-adenosylmethionine/arginine decarboxylase-like enzyme